MSDTLTITIPGELRGKGRPRFSARNGFPRAYTDAKTVSAENWIKSCAVEQVGCPLLTGPLAMTLMVCVGMATSWSKKKRASALAGDLRPTGKPDVDNMCKIACDALNGIAFADDAQIVDLAVTKHYGAIPCAVLTVRQL